MPVKQDLNFAQAIELLRPLQKPRATLYGPRVGFFMGEATEALGGSLATASNILVSLLTQELLAGEFVVLAEGEDAYTLYRLVDVQAPTVH
ncbi:MAG: hypothetical protein ACTS6O_00575 [Giesbergeria sp.]